MTVLAATMSRVLQGDENGRLRMATFEFEDCCCRPANVEVHPTEFHSLESGLCFGCQRIAFAILLLAFALSATSFADEKENAPAQKSESQSGELSERLVKMRSQITDLTAKVNRLEKQLEESNRKVQYSTRKSRESTRKVPTEAPRIKMYPLKHASAEQAVKSVAPLFRTRSTAQTMVISFDTRTNTILARGRGEDLETLSVFLNQLDQPTEDPESN